MKTLMNVLAVLFFSTTLVAGEPDKELHEKCIYPTVMLMSVSPCPGVQGVGSGVIVKSVQKDGKWHNLVFTVAHNIHKTPDHDCQQAPDEKPVPVKEGYYYEAVIGVYEDWSLLKELKKYPCEILYDDDQSGLAVVAFDTNEEMPVAQTDPKLKVYIGNEVYRVGCGLAEPFRLDIGIVTSLPNSAGRQSPDPNTYRISAPTIQGDSGGPVYHENKLIGLAEAIAAMPSGPLSRPAPICHMVYVVPIEEFMKCDKIKKLLQ